MTTHAHPDAQLAAAGDEWHAYRARLHALDAQIDALIAERRALQLAWPVARCGCGCATDEAGPEHDERCALWIPF